MIVLRKDINRHDYYQENKEILFSYTQKIIHLAEYNRFKNKNHENM